MSRDFSLLLLTPCLLLGAIVPLRAGEELQGKVLKPEGCVDSIAVSPNGRWVVAGSEEDTRLWNLKADDLSTKSIVLRGSAGPISPDGQWLMTATNDRDIRLWNLKADDPSAEGQEVARYDANWKSLRGVTISPNNRWLATLSSTPRPGKSRSDKVLRLWDLKAKGEAVQPRVLMERQAGGVTMSADGRWLTSGSMDGKVGVWDLAADDPVSKALVRQITKEGFVSSDDISPDGRWLVTMAGEGVRLWDLRVNDPLARAVGQIGDVERHAVAFSDDSRRLATGWEWGRTRLYDLTATDPAQNPVALTGHRKEDSIEDIAFSPNGRWLLTGGISERLPACLWDLKAKDLTKGVCLKGHTGPVSFLAVSPNSRWLATGSGRVWDLEAADRTTVHAILGGPGGALRAVVFSPDSRWVVGLATDKTARLWDLKAAKK